MKFLVKHKIYVFLALIASICYNMFFGFQYAVNLVIMLCIGLMYALIPFAFIALLIFYVLQFIQKNYMRYNKLFRILTHMIIFGYFGMTYAFYYNRGMSNFSVTAKIAPLLCYLMLFLTNEFIYKKGNTKLYVIIILLMLTIVVLGCELEYLS